MPQADRHDPADKTISARLPKDLKERLTEHIAATGQTRNAFIIEAVREKLAKEETAASAALPH